MDSIGKGVIKKRRIRDFKHFWLEEDIFKGWLRVNSHLDRKAESRKAEANQNSRWW